MRLKITLLLVLVFLCALPVFSQNSPVPVAGWDVSFTLSDNTTTRRLTFISFSNGTGTFRIIGPRNTAQQTALFPAVWSGSLPGSTSFTAEVRLPVSNCCFETGTLIFKGLQVAGSNVITGRAIFVSNTFDPGSPTGYLIKNGYFVAAPLPIIALRKR